MSSNFPCNVLKWKGQNNLTIRDYCRYDTFPKVESLPENCKRIARYLPQEYREYNADQRKERMHSFFESKRLIYSG